MANRYIDADALLERLPNDLPYKDSVKRVLTQAPDADVVPRETIEQIFEEIEDRISNLEYNARTPKKAVSIEELKAQIDWVLHEVVPATMSELKKKYTERSEE